MIAKKNRIAIFIIMLLLVMMSSPTLFAQNPDEPIEMVIAHHFPDDLENNELQLSLVHFKSLVETRTDGGIQVDIYPNFLLGNEIEYTREAQVGDTVQSAVLSQGAFSAFFEDFLVTQVPFLFDNFDVAWEFLDRSEWVRDFMERAREETGLRHLGFFDDGGGFNAFTNDGRLIRTADDLEGLTIRVEENPAHHAIIEGTGANAVMIDWGEVETALATGVAQGQANAPGLNAAMRFWELVDYTSYTGYMYYILTWVVNDDWYNSLPEEYQKIIDQSAREAVKIGRGNAARLTLLGWEEAKRRFKDYHEHTPEEIDTFKDVMIPAFEEWYIEDHGGDEALLDSLLEAVQEYHEMLGYRL